MLFRIKPVLVMLNRFNEGDSSRLSNQNCYVGHFGSLDGCSIVLKSGFLWRKRGVENRRGKKHVKYV